LDERNLWPDTIRVIREVRPRWCLLENVPGLLSRSYIRRIFTDLAKSGYFARWDCIPAAFVGAPHIRSRLWIVAHTNYGFGERKKETLFAGRIKSVDSGKNVSDTNSQQYKSGSFADEWQATTQLSSHTESIRWNGRSGIQEATEKDGGFHAQGNNTWWATEPELGRVANGVANRVDRLRAIGNGQVPAVVRAAWHLMIDETL